MCLSLKFASPLVGDSYFRHDYLLDHSPVLDSLDLCHSSPYINDKKKKAKDWQSKLPRNSSGNYQTACFTDLRVKKRRTEAVKLLSKRLKIKELCSRLGATTKEHNFLGLDWN
uniref:Uncharacterized protein n=1 Tax=Ananas comosus var. bracteatus TaxID=296719 RepID=A0A6V7QKD3_ANACO|nr:unnamed protein product [Ananas comosus var. bracteatus]